MLTFFRRTLKNPLVLAFLGLVGVAMVITMFEAPGAGLGGGSLASGTVAEVGDEEIGEAEMVRRINNQVDALRREQPTLTMQAFVDGGGVEQAVEQAMNARALELFAREQGMVASKKLVDGEIASIPAFAGPTGQFDPTTFQQLLTARGINENELRQDFGREALTRALLVPAAGAARVPNALVQPYAGLLLERRQGQVIGVPAAAFAPRTLPSDAELLGFYRSNVRRYTIPEQRVVRYASFDRSRVDDQARATDAEIKAAYDANPEYKAREKRRFTQVILPTEAQARDLVGRVRGGATLEAAARALGRDAIAVAETEQAAFTTLTAPPVAQAAFRTSRGELAGPARSGLGFHVVRVDAVTTVPATPLASVTTKIAADIAERKSTQAMAEFVSTIEDEATGGATFDELVRKHGLTPVVTPAVTADGRAPAQAGFNPDGDVPAILKDAFQADPDDDPQVATIARTQRYALWKLDRVLPAAPRPLAQLRDQATADWALDKGRRAARVAADRIVAALNSGQSPQAAIATAGVPLPPPSPVNATRLEVARAQGQVPAPVVALFGVPEKRGRVIPVPEGQGWFVVYVSAVVRGDISRQPGLVAATQQQLGQVVGEEYVAQFARAIRDHVGAKRNDAAIAKLKQSLLGGNAGR